MELDYGYVITYNSQRGFGFVSSMYSNSDTFFHISKVSKQLNEKLNNNEIENENILYKKKKTQKGAELVEVLEQVHSITFEDFIFLKSQIFNNIQEKKEFFNISVMALISLLLQVKDIYIPEVEVAEILNNSIFIDVKEYIRKYFNVKRKKSLEQVLISSKWEKRKIEFSKINLKITKIQTKNREKEIINFLGDVKIPFKIDKLGRVLYGNGPNWISHSEVRKRVKEQKIYRINDYSKNEFKNLLARFQKNSAGIRKLLILRGICIECGSNKVKNKFRNKDYYKKCEICNSEWYVNHCWNCGKFIDSRDSEIIECNICNWYKCTCGACSIKGCKSNPYYSSNRLYNYQEENFDISENDIQICDWCNSRTVEYFNEAFNLCHHCYDQLVQD